MEAYVDDKGEIWLYDVFAPYPWAKAVGGGMRRDSRWAATQKLTPLVPKKPQPKIELEHKPARDSDAVVFSHYSDARGMMDVVSIRGEGGMYYKYTRRNDDTELGPWRNAEHVAVSAGAIIRRIGPEHMTQDIADYLRLNEDTEI